MLILIRNAEVWSPEPQGKKDVLLCAGKIARIADPGEIDPRGAPSEPGGGAEGGVKTAQGLHQ